MVLALQGGQGGVGCSRSRRVGRGWWGAPIALIWPIHMYLAKVIIMIYKFIKVDDENDGVRNRLRFRTSLFSSHQSEKEKIAERLSE